VGLHVDVLLADTWLPTVEGHVPKGVEVQVLSSAPKTEEIPGKTGDFCFSQFIKVLPWNCNHEFTRY
jgi:hypothetical protein